MVQLLKINYSSFVNYETENQPKPIQTSFAATSAAPFGSAPNIARPTADELDMISHYLTNKYGYETGPYDNYTTEIKREKFVGRLDWNINAKHRFNVRYSQVEGGESKPAKHSTTGTGISYPTGVRPY